MSETAYTPGPWVFSDERMPDDDSRGWWIEGPKAAFVAETLREPDACLIAAAPDLLEALEEIAEAMPTFRDAYPAGSMGQDFVNETDRTVRAAIAKARGEETPA